MNKEEEEIQFLWEECKMYCIFHVSRTIKLSQDNFDAVTEIINFIETAVKDKCLYMKQKGE